jgi:hypothetical protein
MSFSSVITLTTIVIVVRILAVLVGMLLGTFDPLLGPVVNAGEKDFELQIDRCPPPMRMYELCR